MNFKFTIPCFNCDKYILQCLNSLKSLEKTNWQAGIVNDGSIDNTGLLIKEFLQNNPELQSKIIYTQNNKNEGSPLGSNIRAMQSFPYDPEDIIINLDGDDWLATTTVLNTLEKVYSDSNVWMTYGQYEPASHDYHNYCKPLTYFGLTTKNYRKSNIWTISHLRTFKRKLFNKINDQDLRDPLHGEYYKRAGDAALLYPMAEMSGEKHLRFIPEVLYIYNDLNELNEMKVDSRNQENTAMRIKQKQEYMELESC